jgi:hypothetical protein
VVWPDNRGDPWWEWPYKRGATVLECTEFVFPVGCPLVGVAL